MSTSLVIDVLDDEVVVERRGADGVVSGRAVVPVASTGYRVDPEVWWTALVDAVDAVVGPGALDASGIGEVVLCACPKGVVVTDGHGAPVGPALVGDDPDTAPDAKWLTKQLDGGADGWIAAVGAAPTAQWTTSKLSWLHRSDADVWGRVALVMQPQDYETWLAGGPPPESPVVAGEKLVWRWADGALSLGSPKGRIEPAGLPRRKG